MKFKFSIVMAVYNASQWINEAIDSVINQTIGFENIELILVDDGSIDSSKEICKQYKNEYPDNIKYYYKKNGGQASARNLGLNYVNGEYVNFLDCDDKLDLNACEEVIKFFNSHINETDIVSIPLIFFESEVGDHILNYKFESTRIVDLLKEPTFIQLSASSSFFTYKSLNGFQFDENLITSEDALLINQILLNKCTLGVISSTHYYYRKRNDLTSTTDNFKKRKEYYNDQVNFFLKKIITYSLEKLGYVPNFIQYLVMYTLQWIFEIPHVKNILSDDEIKELYQSLDEILQYIDDDVINKQKNISNVLKVHIFSLKYHGYNSTIENGKNILKAGENPIDILGEKSFWIDIIEIKNNELYISGYLPSFFENNSTTIKAIRITDNNKKEFIGKEVYYPTRNYFSLDKPYGEKLQVDLNIPIINGRNNIIFKVAYDIEMDLPIEFTMNARLSKISQYSRTSYNGKIHLNQYITINIGNSIIIEPYSFKKLLNLDFSTNKKIFKSKKPFFKEALILRIIYFIMSNLFKTKIWLFMDRQEIAKDNAEHLFKYAINQNDNIKKYFIINKDSNDYYKMKKIGKVVKYGSFKHKLLFLLADKIISSHPDDEIINPFWGEEVYLLNGLISAQYIFLQHGIINENLSSWLKKCDMNLTLFLCSAKEEYDSIFKYPYNYDKDVVQILGLPRYDALENNLKNQILIMPSWRHKFVNMTDSDFKSTAYFKNFNKLINDENLIQFSQDNNISIIFKPHPKTSKFIHLFKRNKHVLIDDDFSMDYTTLFNESKLLITDNSSVFYDFSYLKKPVIYFQFPEDIPKFEDKKSEFNFENEGFGEVITNYNDLINIIKDYIQNDCILKSKYEDRINKFYAFNDKNNCKRVYDFLIKLDENIF